MDDAPVPPTEAAPGALPPPRVPQDTARPLGSVWRTLIVSVPAGVTYGLLTRLLFGWEFDAGQPSGVMTMSFLVGVPLVMGFLVAWRMPRPDALRALWLSILAVTGLLLGTAVTMLEGWICIVMMAPAAYVAAGLSAAVATAWRVFVRDEPRGPGPMLAIGLLPVLAWLGERRIVPEDDIRTVETETVVRATPDVVWANVVRVPRIRPEEQATTFFHRIGFPKPIEATIDGRGVGAVRHASFERGVVFVEKVTAWREREEIAFDLDPSEIPKGAFDEHVTPGGPVFTTLEGRYRLEPQGDGTVLLHLSSRSRLTTTAHAIAAPWIDATMRSIQEDILRIVKARCERGEVPE